jgi:cytochrome P450
MEGTLRAKYTYFPFRGGPRTCIGASHAMVELVIVVATIARQFRLRLLDAAGVAPNPRTTLVPNRLNLLLEERS